MKLGVLSDTHGCPSRTKAAIAVFRRAGVERIVHCGDIGSDAIVWLFEGLPVDFVLGNVDRYEAGPLRRAVAETGHTLHEGMGVLALAGRRIALLHGDDARGLHAAVACGDFDLVCHGHTHVAANYRRGKTLVVNPGALYRTSQPSVAIVDLATLEVTPAPLD